MDIVLRAIFKIMESKWTGTVDGAFFNGETFDKQRILKQPEYEHSGRSSSQAFYVIGGDIGRKGCDSVATVVKVTPQSVGPPIKSLVNIYTMSDMPFREQVLIFKRLYYKYQARRLVIDGNGIGINLIDEFVVSQTDDETGDTYPDFGIMNDEAGYYKKYRTNNCETDAVYIIKANAPLNTEAHSNLAAQLNSGKLKFLQDERTAKARLLGTKAGQAMTPEERNDYLRPFQLTSNLKEELMNLREETEGINIILKQSNKRIPKDKVSSLEYALYYIKQEEENKKKKKKFNIKEYMFMN